MVFVLGGKLYREKNPRSKARPNNKLNPHMKQAGLEPRPHGQWWEASALATAPTLLPSLVRNCKYVDTDEIKYSICVTMSMLYFDCLLTSIKMITL